MENQKQNERKKIHTLTPTHHIKNTKKLSRVRGWSGRRGRNKIPFSPQYVHKKMCMQIARFYMQLLIKYRFMGI